MKRSHELPEYLIYDCASRKLMSQQAFKLYPIKSDIGQDIEDASLTLLNYHSTKFAKINIVAQVTFLNKLILIEIN